MRSQGDDGGNGEEDEGACRVRRKLAREAGRVWGSLASYKVSLL